MKCASAFNIQHSGPRLSPLSSRHPSPFAMERDAAAAGDRLDHAVSQAAAISGSARSTAGIDDPVGVRLADGKNAFAHAFAASLFEQPSGRKVGSGVAEDTTSGKAPRGDFSTPGAFPIDSVQFLCSPDLVETQRRLVTMTSTVSARCDSPSRPPSVQRHSRPVRQSRPAWRGHWQAFLALGAGIHGRGAAQSPGDAAQGSLPPKPFCRGGQKPAQSDASAHLKASILQLSNGSRSRLGLAGARRPKLSSSLPTTLVPRPSTQRLRATGVTARKAAKSAGSSTRAVPSPARREQRLDQGRIESSKNAVCVGVVIIMAYLGQWRAPSAVYYGIYAILRRQSGHNPGFAACPAVRSSRER